MENLDFYSTGGTCEGWGGEAGGGCDFRRETWHVSGSLPLGRRTHYSALDGAQFYGVPLEVSCQSHA